VTRAALRTGLAVPFLYFGTVIVASLTWPGYSHVTQYVSELGSADAPHPWLFNIGILATGAAGVLGGAGIFRYLSRAGRPWSGGVAGLALAAWGLGMVFGGTFPMPDPRHNGFGLVFGIVFLPPSLLVALRGGRARANIRGFLVGWLSAMVVLLAIMFGVGSLVTRANVGLWQRVMAVAMIPGVGIACGYLARRAGAGVE